MDADSKAQLDRIEATLVLLYEDVHTGLKPRVANLERRASFWGALGGAVSAFATVAAHFMAGCG